MTTFWSWFVRITTNWLPDIPCVMRFRGRLYGLFMKEIGRNFQVASDVRFSGLRQMRVGNDVYIGCNSVLLANGGIEIGDQVLIAHKAMIITGNHVFSNGSYRFSSCKRKPVILKKGCWIAAHCTVLPGVTVGEGAVLGANSVATRDIPDRCLAVGVPAKVVKNYSE